MNIQFLMAVIGFLFVFIGIIINLPWAKWLYSRFGDNPDKARVFLYDGVHKVKGVDGKKVKYKKYALSFMYKNYSKKLRTVVVPSGYPEIFIQGKRWIWVEGGKLIATLPGYNPKIKLKNYDSDEFDTLVGSHLAVDIVNSVTGKAIGWLMILLVAGACVAGFFLFRNFFGSEEPPIPVSTNQTQIITPPQYPIERSQ